MKKLIFLTILIVGLSCEKQPAECFICEVNSLTLDQGIIMPELSDNCCKIYCGVPEHLIRTYEQGWETTQYVNMFSQDKIVYYDLTVITSVKCTRK